MSNTRALGDYTPTGDMGIGLCTICVGEAKAAPPAERKPPQFAITLVPHLQVIPGAMAAIVTVGACWDHIGGGDPQQQQQPRRPLLVAQGGMPG